MSNPGHYSRIQIALHWLIALMIAAQFLLEDDIGDAFEARWEGESISSGAQFMADIHVYTGLAILGLVVLRLVVRLLHGAPPPPPGENALQVLVAKGTHGLLYLLMLLIPISGAVAWYKGIEDAGDMHEVFGNVLLALVALHALAALVHHYVLKTDVLRRMLPWRG